MNTIICQAVKNAKLLTNEELMNVWYRHKDGDHSAIEKIYSSVYKMIFGLIIKCRNRLSDANIEQEEMFNQIILQLKKIIDSYSPNKNTSLKTWIYINVHMILRNPKRHIFSLFERRNNPLFFSDLGCHNGEVDHKKNQQAIEECVGYEDIEQEENIDIYDAIDKLSDEDRIFLYLQYDIKSKNVNMDSKILQSLFKLKEKEKESYKSNVLNKLRNIIE